MRKLFCLEAPIWGHLTTKEMAARIGVTPSALRSSVSQGCRCRGFTILQVGTEVGRGVGVIIHKTTLTVSRNEPVKMSFDQVHCPTVASAARHLGVHPNAVRYAAKNGGQCKGYRITFAHRQNTDKKVSKHKAIKCLDTGRVFRSIKEASEATGFSRRVIERGLSKGKRSRAGNFVPLISHG